MHHPMKELPLVEDHGEGFRSRLVEWAEYQRTIDVAARNIAAMQGKD